MQLGIPLLKSCILNIQNIKTYSKKDFVTSLKQSQTKKYLMDWQHSNETLKDGKLVTYIFLKTNFRVEKYSSTDLNTESQSVDCGYQRIYFLLNWADIITHLEQKEYVTSEKLSM